MFMMLPVPVRHEITNEIVDSTVALVSMDMASVLDIREDIETGYANIYYKSGVMRETLQPFKTFLEEFHAAGLIAYTGAESCRKISKSVNTFLTKKQM